MSYVIMREGDWKLFHLQSIWDSWVLISKSLFGVCVVLFISLSLWGSLVRHASLSVYMLDDLDKKKKKGTESLSQGVKTWVLHFHLLALQPKLNWTADPPEGAVPGFDLTLSKKAATLIMPLDLTFRC